MRIIEKKNGKIEYHPSEGYRFITKDRTKVLAWFVTLNKGGDFNYIEVPEKEAIELEQELKNTTK